MMNIKHILSRGHRAGGLAEANGTPGFAMRFIMSLLLMVTLGGGSSVWAQAVSQLPSLTSGVYEMLNISNESGTGTGRGYLVNYTNASSGIGLADCTYSQYRGSHPTVKNSANTCSYWYLHKNENGSYTIVSLSTLGGNEQPRFIQVGDPSSLTTTETELVFADATNANHVRDGKKAIVIANKTASNLYMSAACGTNSNNNCIKRTTTITDGGNPWLFIPVAESSLSEGQKAIRAKYLERFAHLKDGVTINFQDKNGNAITGETVVYTPTSGPAVNLTSSTGTYNFGDVLYSPSLFSSADFAKILSVAYNETGKTLTFTITQNKWYYIMCRNGNTYVSSDYVNGSGDMMLNNTNKPTDYKGLWMEIPTTDLDANGQGTVYFVNAYYGDTKILAITGSGSSASAKMYSKTDVPAGAVTLFDRKYRADRDGAFFFKSAGSANNYLNKNQNKFAYWDNANAYNNPDNGSTFDHTAVPNLPNNATIQFVAASSAVTIPAGLNVVYRNLEFIRKDGSSTTTTVANISELTHNQHYNFDNVPGLTSLFTPYNHPELRVAKVEVEGTTVKLIIDRLPKIIHRQHATFDHLATVGAAQKPNSKFIQEGKGLIDHPNAANFTGAGYTDNDRKIQNTSVFHITQYTTKGGTTTVALPHTRTGGLGKINKYQRIYNYLTERPLGDGIVSGMSGYTMYSNGQARKGDIKGSLTVTLPSDKDEITIGVDDSEFNDYSTDSDGNLVEPSLSMRTIIHIVSAEKMASALVEKGGDKWWEEKTYIVPNIKRGSATHRNNSDLLPLDMPFSNYWVYDNSHNPMRIVAEGGNYNTLTNNLSIEIEGSAASHITADIFKDANGPGLHGPLGVAYNHFIYYKVKGSGLTREVPAGSQAIIKVYAHNGASGTKYQLAKFTLNFQADCEPLAITSVVGNENSTRSRDYFLNQKMAEVASLTFSEKKVGFKGFGGVSGNDTHYAFPLDPTRTSYAFSPDDAFGGYRITKSAYGMKVLPVSLYERNIKNKSTSLTVDDDDYYLYIDAAEAPGQVASIPLDGNLCAGTRLFFYGWLNSQNPFESGNATAASVILELVGRKAGKDVTLATYLPGVVSDAAYTPEGTVIRSVKDGSTASTEAAYSFSYNLNGHGDDQTRIAAWQSIGFSYLLTESGFDGFELRVINNCYSTAGGDYSLDDFRVFVNPPKGSVDFTTPLCSDKVRHAKIHSDFDMLKNISNVNETTPGAKLSVSYCFLEADVFDNYSAGGLTISDIFEVDAQTGNHNLKAAYKSDPAAITLINNAFGKALVGTRQLASADPEKGGFHTFDISLNYESIPVYAYNDSQNEVVYREEGSDGIRRIVFKEDVIRGEMAQIEYDGQKHYPHMRPSTTYYLVFTPNPVDNDDISGHTVGTNTFLIQDNCSFFGKFKTKDPLHVILDNADIESDLPIKAVCHGETTAFQFNLPAMKVDKPIVDEAYCISDESLNGKIVPESQGLNHYKYEASFKSNDISGVIKNLSYDWWMGGKYDDTHSFRGTIEGYQAAKHPTIKYDHNTADPSHTHTHAADYKKHQEPVDISLAMQDFRFFYPDFKEGDDWGSLQTHDYDNDSGYSLLQSEINSIKDLVEKGIIILHRNTYDMPLTYEEAEELQAKELNDMMEKEMNDQILELALKLNTDPAVAALLPLKALEGTVLDKLSLDGKKRLTFEEFGNFTRDQLVDIAGNLQTHKAKLTELTSVQINAMQEGELRRVVESALRELPDDEMLGFAKDYFPNIGHEKRAYLVVRALNILSRETVAKLPVADQQNTTIVRAKLREQMISIFSAQKVEVLRKMWSDVSAKLTAEERAELLKDAENPGTPKNPATMNADGLAVLVEDGLAQFTNNVINDLQGDRYVHFTLVPIMPSQKTFVDEPYIFCPDPRGVKLRITSHEPEMLDGFADMTYPEDMKNVPVRIGLKQIKETMASTAKTLRIPVRGLKQAAKNGIKAVKLDVRTGYYNEIFLVETDDPQYQQTVTTGMAEAKNSAGVYTRMIGTIQEMVATYPTALDKTPNNYLVVKFKDDMKFREGYTYRVGINFMEHDSEDHETISCPGEMRLDMKIVPEYQKWTASVNSDWTNDQNWARADRTELNADNAATGSVIAGSTDITVAANYPTNEANKKSSSFVPMYFTNVLVDGNAGAPVLYPVTAASRGEKKFLQGLTSDDATQAQHIYDMEVAPSTGTWHDNNNYECTLFGTYVANGITFKPGSQLINAQHLTYNKAWVEYELTTNRWYTLASPLQNTFAGEWYSPTAGGKQLTPHFYDITYQQGGGSQNLNDRFRPAYYQRSWDSKGNNPVYLKTGGTQNAYIMADWSYVYNDVTKEYSNGGFSVMVDDSHMGTPSGSVINRMPKADTKYTYFDIDGKIGQRQDDVLSATAKRNRLWSDELNSVGGTFQHTITNATSGNNFFLVANPFMANMDMDEFFAVNSEKIEPKFWIMTANGQEVSVRTETGWVTTSDQVTTLGKSAPLQGFFVKGKSASNTVEITYTAAMQAQASVAEQLKSKAKAFSDNEPQMLTLKAQYGDMTSTAVVALGKNAQKTFVTTEDCETFIDSNIADLPTIYTVASGQALTVNTVPEVDMIPIGILGETGQTLDVTFSGMSGLCLYDSKDNSYTDISEGTEVTMEAKTTGRYFITSSSSTTAIDGIATDAPVRKGIYTLGGQYVGEDVKTLAPGLYIVNGVKMRVK